MTPPNPQSRINDLRRQRDLLREHLAWLEREIAATENALGTEPAATPKDDVTATTAPGPSFVPASAANTDALFKTTGKEATPATPDTAAAAPVDPDADAILDEYRTPRGDLQRDVKMGCFLYFAAALLIFGVAVVVLYFALRHK